MTSYGGKAPRRTEDVRVDPALHPDWVTGVDRLPKPGETVLCSEGLAEVVRLLGKTENGRLLELKVREGRTVPFFAAAGNVLVPPARALP